MNFKFIVITVLLLLPSVIFAQVKLNGSVSDSETGEKLESVNIYIPELQRGTVTDKNGDYSIENLPKGSFSIQFSYVGYKSKVVLEYLNKKPLFKI